MSKKVIVSGASGQDGSYMIEYLLKNTDFFIVGTMRRTSQAILSNLKDVISNPRLKLVTMDLNDPHSIEGVISSELPDYFINFGAQTFVADSWTSPASHMQTNAVSIIHILESIRKHTPNCRVYSSGSSEQWGDVKYSPQDEKHPMSPRSVYGASKCAAAHICKIYRESYNMYIVHGTLLNHESERRQDYFVSRKITKGVARIYHAIKNGWDFEPIEIGNLDAYRDWSHALDFVEGIWKMLHQEKCREDLQKHLITRDIKPSSFWADKIKEYVLSSNEKHQVRELIEVAFNEAGIKGYWSFSGMIGNTAYPEHEVFREYKEEDGRRIGLNTIFVKVNPKFYRPAEVGLLHGDSTLARIELKWEPKISFDELIKNMVKNDIATYTSQ
ncbi:MAG: GDP-mannose 4,6-dehydratase [Sulfurimonas sp.]|jgi:GDPmannose 4,6-dehydratase